MQEYIHINIFTETTHSLFVWMTITALSKVYTWNNRLSVSPANSPLLLDKRIISWMVDRVTSVIVCQHALGWPNSNFFVIVGTFELLGRNPAQYCIIVAVTLLTN